ncbi:hypothetical protein DFH08DRAFT_817609 [Mycena albidolilacea]|uniref:Uncharacterized protein n=1 Tax=Mycena albidolilacea TaxID=1033008 RepID=A0AAD6ZIH9_9AGAR|nr:hypothetical protein DFH08DRAFT_817609 [Mycena albidolilacea]
MSLKTTSSPLVHVVQLVPTLLPLPPTRRIQAQPMQPWTISLSIDFFSVNNSDLCFSLPRVPAHSLSSSISLVTVTLSYRNFRRKNSSTSNFLINFDASLLTSAL